MEIVTPSDRYRAYVGRNFRDFDHWKEKPREQVERALREHGIDLAFHTKPYLHQLVCFLLGVTNDHFLFFADMGLGKTKVLCDVFRWRRKADRVRGMLVVVPYVYLIESWRRELATHAPELKVYTATNGSREFADAIRASLHDVYVVTRQSFLEAVSTKRKVLYQGKKYTRRDIDEEFVTDLVNATGMLVLDECDSFKNPKSKSFRVLSRFVDRFRYRYGATGTPFGTTMHDIWAQYQLVDLGETFRDIRTFTRMFFRTVYTRYGEKYIVKEECIPDIQRMMKNCSIRYAAHECLDLPEVVRTCVEFTLPKQLWDDYEAVVRRMEEERNLIEIRSEFARLRMITSGFVSFRDAVDEDARVRVPLAENPRLEALRGILEHVPEGRKVVVFHEFVKSGDMLEELVRGMGLNYVRLYSGTKDKMGELSRFLEDPDVRVALANTQSTSAGLNLQVANYVVFYETPVSPRYRVQAEARCIRHGQKRTVFVYDLVARRTIDVAIYRKLSSGVDLLDEVLDGVKSGKTDHIRKFAYGEI